MAGQHRTLLILGAALAAGIAAAVLALLSADSGGTRGDGEPASVPDSNASKPSVQPARGPRRAGTAAVLGEIRRTAGRAPVAGQAVVLAPADGPAWTVTTDAQGAFRLGGIPHGGPYELSVTAAGCGTIRLPGIALGRNEQRNVGTLWLDAAVRLALRVRDHRDEPVAGAVIEAFPVAQSIDYDWSKALAQLGQEPIAVARTSTDAKGEAEFPEMAVGSWTFTAKCKGFAPGGARDVTLRSGEEPDVVTIHLWPGHPLDGRVLAADGTPLASAVVLAGATNSEWDPQSAPHRSRAVADASGRYAFAALDPGAVQLWVARPGGIPSPAAVVRVPLVPHYDIVLKGSGSLAGVVTEKESGAPVEGAVVRAASWEGVATSAETVTGADGLYALEMAAGPVNELTVEKEGLLQVAGAGDAGNERQAVLHEGQTAVRNLEMRRAARLSGKVTGPEGPLSGVKVVVHVPTPDGGFTQKFATTGGDGRYELAAVEKGNLLVLAEKDGWWLPGAPAEWWDAANQPDSLPEFRVEVPETGEAAKDLEMKRGVRIDGRVEGADGAPLAGVRVLAPGADGPAVSAADGAFEVDGVKPGREVVVTCEKDGLTQAQMQPIEVVPDRPVTGLVLRMLKRSRVRGTVTSSSGVALRDTRVLLAHDDTADGDDSRWTELYRWENATRVPVAANGSFDAELPFAAPGRLLVRAVSLWHQQGDAAPVELVEGQPYYEVDVALADGVSLAGRVVAKGGAPVAGAEVSVAPHEGDDANGIDLYGGGGSPSVWAVTDAAGAFTVAHLAPGMLDVRVRARGFVPSQTVVDLATTPIAIVEMSPEMSIEGTVVLADGSPVEGVQIDASDVEDAPQVAFMLEGRSAVADARGVFRVTGLLEGRYTLAVTVPWGARINVRSKTVGGIAAGSRDVRITVEEGGTITGRTLDAKRRPVAGVWISCSVTEREDDEASEGSDEWHSVESGPDGAFALVGLSGGPYTLQFSGGSGAGGFQQKTLENVAAGTKGLEVVLEPGLSIAGVVVDADGRPIARMSLDLSRVKDDGASSSSESVWTDPQGRFTFSGLSTGRYGIDVSHWGGENQGWLVEPAVTAEAGASGVRVVASRGATVSGVVVDDRGAVIARASVRASEAEPGSNVWREAQTKADGTFQIAGLPRSGPFTVTASEDAHLEAKLENVAPGARDVRIVLPLGLEVTGRLLDASGRPMPRASLLLTIASEGRNQHVQTDGEGRFRVRGLSPGTYEAQTFVQTAGGAGDWKTCGRVKGGDRDVELRIQ